MRIIAVPVVSIIALLLVSTVLIVSVNAAELNVGSGAQYKSITEAVNAAQPGDTIIVSQGTYSENVVVTKSVTIKAASPGSTTVTAANAATDVFHVRGQNVRIEGLTITGASGAAAIYLDGASNCEVNSCVLDSNSYGVYCDHSFNNSILNNAAGAEHGNSKTLGDGIYLYYCDNNLVNHNNLSANHVFGISLWYSNGNTITNNSITKNEDIGTRLGSSNNNTLVYNIYSGNVNAGIVPVSATGNKIYLNNFINQNAPIGAPEQQTLNSPEQLSYTFNGATHTGYMGNYYSDYKGSDSNGTGIGSPAAGNGDKFPLVQPVEKYTNIGSGAATQPASSPTPPAQSSAVSANETTNLSNSAAQASTPGFDVGMAFLSIGLVAFILISLRIRRR